MNRTRSAWWTLTKVGVFLGLFVWLRWYSSLWQNRWTGFCLGVVLVIWVDFTSRNWVRGQLDFARKRDLSKRVTLVFAVACTWMCVSALKSFFVGPPFFFSSGVRATSDNAFFGVLLIPNTLQWLYASWVILRKGSDQSSQNPVVPVNHG